MVKNQSKRAKRKRPVSKKYKFYTMDGEVIKRGKTCPRCGPGIFLAEAKDRIYCGKCHWTEFMGKSDMTSEKGEQKKPSEKAPVTEKVDEKK